MTSYVYRGDSQAEVRPMTAAAFHAMTPRQRRELAGKRERQVNAAQRQHVKRHVLADAADRDRAETLDRLIAAMASLMPIPDRDLCSVPDCRLVVKTQRLCDKHYRWIRKHERRAA